MNNRIAVQRKISRSRSCLRCGAVNAAEATHCSRCGEKLRAIKVTNRQEKKKLRLGSAELQKVAATGSEVTASFEVNKIYCGDCLEIMRRIPDEFAQSLAR